MTSGVCARMKRGLAISSRRFSVAFGAGLAAALFAGFAGEARAFGPPTVGDVVVNTINSSSELPTLFAAVSFLFGGLLVVLGVLKLKEHVTSPQQVPLSEAVKRFVVGGALLALPIVIEAAYNTLSDGCIFGGCGADGTGFNATVPVGNGLDAVIANMMADLWQPLTVLFGAFSYIAGLLFIILGISRLLKSSQEGPRGPSGAGTITTFLVGGALLSVDAMMGAFSNSLFPSLGGNLQTYGQLAFSTTGMSAAEIAHIETTLAAILAFMMIIGWISFIRGFFILRDVAEGNHQASMMAGMTHIFGGALAVNLGPVMNAIQSTFGITGLGIDFS